MQANVRLVRLPLGTRYAIQGMVFLARQPQPSFYLLKDIAKAASLPTNYLSKIFQDLVRAGLLESRKGRGGGYGLVSSPEKIRLLEIVDAIQDHFPEQSHCVLSPSACSSDAPCVLHESVRTWENLMKLKLQSTTLRDAVEGVSDRREDK